MNYTPSRLLVAAAGVVLCASCGPQLTTTTVPMSSKGSVVSKSDGSVAGTIHAQVNDYRSAVGRTALPRHAGLDKMAREHSEYMLQNRNKARVDGTTGLTHFGFEERSLKAQRVMSMAEVGENIATCHGQGKNAAGVMVNAWKNSSGHVENMRAKWSVTGIGVAVAPDGTVFATQLFANEDLSHMTMSRQMRQF
ncbi:CAP domain-containing protein [Luteolibacter sp. Populi]|uniref:CAP domain-containing protein n=1 Tax=Luteolibacter sp. Populi TaxID=3230487 RepID=UPI00346641A3